MKHSRVPPDSLKISWLAPLAVILFTSLGAHGQGPRTCIGRYDSENEIIRSFEKKSGVSPLIPSNWAVEQEGSLKISFAAAGGGGIITTIHRLSEEQIETIVKEQIANGSRMKVAVIRAGINAILSSSGFQFNSKLCRNNSDELEIMLVGIGAAKGKTGMLKVKPDASEITLKGILAGGVIDVTVKASK